MVVVKVEDYEGNPVLCGPVAFFFFISIQAVLILLQGWKGCCLKMGNGKAGKEQKKNPCVSKKEKMNGFNR